MQNIQVSGWLKSLMRLIALAPALLSLAVFVPHGSWPGPNLWLSAAGVCLLLAASIVLFRRIFFVSSIELTEDGLKQSVLSLRSGVRHIKLSWDQVVQVTFSGLSIYFVGENNEKLELNSGLFNNSAEIIRTVRDRLPDRLKRQL